PDERAVLVPGLTPAAAYTIKGRLGIFCPSLDLFSAPKNLSADVIAQPDKLAGLVAEIRGYVAAHPAKAGSRLPTDGLDGDTPDAQMRRAFLAFDAAGLAPQLRSVPNDSSLAFSWQGVNYVYGQDQRLARLN
ncbi:MAG TPA: hypothetical protein VHV47_02455, partial [Opitutaceae bacterium]|nr:hypothetical protein [Opitutaceae bacterium]